MFFVSFSIRLGIFLRRYPMARVFVIIYMVSTSRDLLLTTCGLFVCVFI